MLMETNMPTLDLDRMGSAMGDRPWAVDGSSLLISRVDASGRTAIYRVDRDTGEAEQLPPHRVMSLDDAIEYLAGDELLEVTPGALRIRKKELVHVERARAARKAQAA